MAANTIAWGETRTPIHLGEHLLTPGYACDIELKIPPTIDGPKRTERAWGRVWLTDQRIVFIALKRNKDELNTGPPAQVSAPPIHSLVIPYETIKDNQFKLPLFQVNHQLISFVPDPTHPKPDLPDPGIGAYLVCKLVVFDGLGHNLYKRIEKERDAWIKRLREAETLPAYTPRAD